MFPNSVSVIENSRWARLLFTTGATARIYTPVPTRKLNQPFYTVILEIWRLSLTCPRLTDIIALLAIGSGIRKKLSK